MTERVHITVAGRVQGVGFRMFVQEAAERLRLVGSVRNVIDGTVEVKAEGERRRLEQLLKQVEKGNRLSGETECIVEWTTATGQYWNFQVIP